MLNKPFEFKLKEYKSNLLIIKTLLKTSVSQIGIKSNLIGNLD